MQIHFLHIIPVWEPIRTRASGQTASCPPPANSSTRQLPQIAATQNLMPAAQCLARRNAYQGNCIKLGQTHVRLPESGGGAPCGRPPQGITPQTVQIVMRYRKFQTSLATGGRFLGRKKKTIGSGRPSQGITPRTVQVVVRYRKFQTSLATGGRFLGRQKKKIRRGAPCGRPSSAILASELRCVCPVMPTHHHCAPLPAHSQDQRHQPRQ